MSEMQPKSPRLRLDSEAYRRLQLQILKRDGWRCQGCGRMERLEVHHIQFRSHAGNDSESNLGTLCAECHRQKHSH